MLPVVAAIVLASLAPPTYPDRADFLRKLKALPERAPRAQVLATLGKPDRIESSSVTMNGKLETDETWFYGTDGSGAATLARITVYEGKLAYHPVRESPPPTSVISEAELRSGLHTILDKMPSAYGDSNVDLERWVARSTNALLPFGEAKCKAIVGECGRLMEGYSQLNPCPYFLSFSLFDPPKPPGYFEWGPVWDAPEPKDRLAHPRWPVEIVNNVPTIKGKPVGGFGGKAPSFELTFMELRPRIHLRKKPLTVPK